MPVVHPPTLGAGTCWYTSRVTEPKHKPLYTTPHPTNGAKHDDPTLGAGTCWCPWSAPPLPCRTHAAHARWSNAHAAQVAWLSQHLRHTHIQHLLTCSSRTMEQRPCSSGCLVESAPATHTHSAPNQMQLTHNGTTPMQLRLPG